MLIGNSSVRLEFSSAYTDEGAIAEDNRDRNITTSIITVNPVDVSTAGTYTVTYNVAATQVTRTVVVADYVPKGPNKISLRGSASINLALGSDYTDAGATAVDAKGRDITSSIVTANPVDVNTAGTYTVTYTTAPSGSGAFGDEFRVSEPVPTFSALDNPVVTQLLDGGFVVTWEYIDDSQAPPPRGKVTL